MEETSSVSKPMTRSMTRDRAASPAEPSGVNASPGSVMPIQVHHPVFEGIVNDLGRQGHFDNISDDEYSCLLYTSDAADDP